MNKLDFINNCKISCVFKRTRVRCLLFWINTHLADNPLDSSLILSSKRSESLMKCEKSIYIFFLIFFFIAFKMLIEAWLKVPSECERVVQRLDLWNMREILHISVGRGQAVCTVEASWILNPFLFRQHFHLVSSH